jgi:hypothetical protein
LLPTQDSEEAKKWKYRTPQTGGAVDPRNWLPASRWLEIVTDPTRNASASPPPAKSSARNYDGKLAFELMRAKCGEPELSVGHMGGASDLRKRTAAEVRAKVWKYRTPQNEGTVVASNWLPAALWLEIVDGLT